MATKSNNGKPPFHIETGFESREVKRTEWLVCPDLAGELLARNRQNRKLQEKYVDYLAETIKSGEWLDEVCPFIAFDVEGKLVDGQHRLHAIQKARLPRWLEVRFGLSIRAQQCIDQGKPRSMFDTVKLADSSVEKHWISAVNLLGYYGVSNSRWLKTSRPKMETAIAAYRHCFEFVDARFDVKKRTLGRSCFYTAFVAAYAHLEGVEGGVEFLERALAVWGGCKPRRKGERAIAALRDHFLADEGAAAKASGQQERLNLFFAEATIDSAFRGNGSLQTSLEPTYPCDVMGPVLA